MITRTPSYDTGLDAYSASPEFMVLETCWQLSKDVLLVMTYYASFGDLKMGGEGGEEE
ncbi:MAG TPA: hypothetical protein VNI77_06140 [Nitrososphaera sp.]|nr:hypothetical protein [Nitrososphaera sp.]